MTPRIALVSAHAGRQNTAAHWPHFGLVLLATELKRAGFEPLVFDQSFLRCDNRALADRVRRFDPALVGVSLFTTHVGRGMALTGDLQAALPGVPFIAGGPHVTLYAESMTDAPFAALVRGEAEQTVAPVVRRVLAGERPGIVESGINEPEKIPVADFRLAVGHEKMLWLPIQLSRGCPFNCSFCEIRNIASRKMRYRDRDTCLAEIAANLKLLPHVHTVRIVDDCPTLDRARFKGFLRAYLDSGLPARISVDNMRADTIDGELLDLMKACRTPSICLAAESGNPEVFAMVDKGETLEEVRAAAGLVRRKGIPLQMCFVVGLPGSTFQREMDSLRLARQLRPEVIYWNMFLPHPGTPATAWFAEHGRIFEERDSFSIPDYNLQYSLPTAETPEFSRNERLRAWLKCVLETASFIMTPLVIARAVRLAIRFGLVSSIPTMFAAMPGKALMYAHLAVGRLRARLGRPLPN